MSDSKTGGALACTCILVVEDESLIAMELDSLLHQEGCNVLGPAATVERALALIDKQRPDAAILDLNLNGEPALPIVAALGEQGVPFVLVSGYSETQFDQPELRHAPRLAKPVKHRELVQTLKQVLSRYPIPDQ
jgi:two-component system, response regulator PdtaR